MKLDVYTTKALEQRFPFLKSNHLKSQEFETRTLDFATLDQLWPDEDERNPAYCWVFYRNDNAPMTEQYYNLGNLNLGEILMEHNYRNVAYILLYTPYRKLCGPSSGNEFDDLNILFSTDEFDFESYYNAKAEAAKLIVDALKFE